MVTLPKSVTPAKAGVQGQHLPPTRKILDSGLRRNDGLVCLPYP